jgi:hypothetical protein
LEFILLHWSSRYGEKNGGGIGATLAAIVMLGDAYKVKMGSKAEV